MYITFRFTMSMKTYIKSKSSDTAYLVAIFIKTDEVAVIPHNWLISSDQCIWPRYQTQIKTNKTVISSKTPDKDWETYTIKIASGSGTYTFL